MDRRLSRVCSVYNQKSPIHFIWIGELTSSGWYDLLAERRPTRLNFCIQLFIHLVRLHEIQCTILGDGETVTVMRKCIRIRETHHSQTRIHLSLRLSPPIKQLEYAVAELIRVVAHETLEKVCHGHRERIAIPMEL